MLRKSLVFILFYLLTVSVQAQAGEALKKRISWRVETDNFREALASFENLTGVFFQYDSKLTPSKRVFKFAVRNQIAADALHEFLHRYGLDFSVVMDQSIVLKPWKPIDNSLRISGSLTNGITGERIIGASVFLEN